MQLIGTLTSWTLAAGCAFGLSGCAGNAPKRPAAAPAKSVTVLDARCVDAYNRGGFAPAGCQDYYETRRARRTAPRLEEPMALPTLPSGSLPGAGLGGGGLIRR